MNCPVCGAANETAAIYCYRCGSALRPSGGQPQPATGRTTVLAGDERASAPPEDHAASGGSVDWASELPPAQPLSPSSSGARTYNTPRSIPSTPFYVGPAPVTTQTSTLAVLALILGILSWNILPFVGSIGAVITGRMARREIRESGGRFTGQGLATAGITLGYLSLALSLLIFVGFCVFFLGLASIGQ